jgi:hypothetical protein
MIFIVNQGGPVDSSGQTEGSADAVIVKGRMIVFSAWPSPDATFKDIMVAFLGIAFAFIGQITLPSFIAEMNDPRFVESSVLMKIFHH